MADVHGKITFKLLTPPLYWKCLKSFKFGLEDHGKVSVAVIVT